MFYQTKIERRPPKGPKYPVFCPWWPWPSNLSDWGTKHVFLVNMAQICSVVSDWHISYTKKTKTAPTTEPYGTACDNNFTLVENTFHWCVTELAWLAFWLQERSHCWELHDSYSTQTCISHCYCHHQDICWSGTRYCRGRFVLDLFVVNQSIQLMIHPNEHRNGQSKFSTMKFKHS